MAINMDFEKATKQQLLTVLYEDCPIHYKYQAAFELQKRKGKEKSRMVSSLKNKASFTDKTYKVSF